MEKCAASGGAGGAMPFHSTSEGRASLPDSAKCGHSIFTCA